MVQRPRALTIAAAAVCVLDLVVEAAATGLRQAQTVTQYSLRFVLNSVLDQIDLTDVVLERVQFQRIIDEIDLDSVAARIDIEAILARLDLTSMAREVIEDINLPDIIRESSGTVASETVIGARMRAIEGDELVTRIMGRLMARRHRPPDGTEPAIERVEVKIDVDGLV